MTSRDLGFVLLRGFGLVMLIEAALGLPSSVQSAADALSSPKEAKWLFSTLVAQFLIRLGIGAFLLLRSPRLAAQWFSSDSTSAGAGTGLFQAAIATLGVYFVASGFIDLASQVYVGAVLRSTAARIQQASAGVESWFLVGLPVIRILVGFALFTLSNRLARSWSALSSQAGSTRA